MKAEIVAHLCAELKARGFNDDLVGPHDTISFSRDYLAELTLADFADLVISRREKMFRSIPDLGADVAKACYSDAVLAVEACSVVINRLAGN